MNYGTEANPCSVPPPSEYSETLAALRKAIWPFSQIRAEDGDRFDAYPDQAVIHCVVTVGEIKAARHALTLYDRPRPIAPEIMDALKVARHYLRATSDKAAEEQLPLIEAAIVTAERANG